MSGTGTGTPSRRPVDSQRRASLKPEIGRPSVNSSDAPRATLIIPSVAMNGGSFPRVMSSPLRSPHSELVSRPASTANGTGQSACSRLAITTPDSATSEPTERSIPAERITNVMPTAITAFMDVCSITLSTFETVRKKGERKDSNAHSRNNPASVPARRLRIRAERSRFMKPVQAPRRAAFPGLCPPR